MFKNIIFCFIGYFTLTMAAKGALPLVLTEGNKNPQKIILITVEDKLKLLEYTKELQIQSQIIVKDYFYLAQEIPFLSKKVTIELEDSGEKIEHILNILSLSLKNREIQNLLSYLNENNKELNQLLKKPYSPENAEEILDISASFDEAAQQISVDLSKGIQIQNKNKLIFLVLQQKLILQQMSKFYIAYQAGFNDTVILEKLSVALTHFKMGLKTLASQKSFNLKEKKIIKKLTYYWMISKKYYKAMKKGELSIMIFISTTHMVKHLDKLLVVEGGNLKR